jgi:hypothetical protein
MAKQRSTSGWPGACATSKEVLQREDGQGESSCRFHKHAAPCCSALLLGNNNVHDQRALLPGVKLAMDKLRLPR